MVTVAELPGVPESSWNCSKPCGKDRPAGGVRTGASAWPVTGIKPAVLAGLTCQRLVMSTLPVATPEAPPPLGALACGAVQLAFPVGLVQDQFHVPMPPTTRLAEPELQRWRVGVNAAVTTAEAPQTPGDSGLTLTTPEAAPVPAAFKALTLKS